MLTREHIDNLVSAMLAIDIAPMDCTAENCGSPTRLHIQLYVPMDCVHIFNGIEGFIPKHEYFDAANALIMEYGAVGNLRIIIDKDIKGIRS